MQDNEISFNEFLDRLKNDAEKYFDCYCTGIKNDDEEITFEMSESVDNYTNDMASGNFDNGYEQWHINYIYFNENKITFSYKNLSADFAHQSI